MPVPSFPETPAGRQAAWVLDTSARGFTDPDFDRFAPAALEGGGIQRDPLRTPRPPAELVSVLEDAPHDVRFVMAAQPDGDRFIVRIQTEATEPFRIVAWTRHPIFVDGMSTTAATMGCHRAAHRRFDEDPKLVDDSVVERLLGGWGERNLASPHHRTPGAAAARAPIVLRARLAEDEVRAAVARGVSQYVILGAGLDTFAYRNAHTLPTLQIFEVDQGSTQRWKRARLAECGIVVPPTLELVQVDFERDSLEEVLVAHGFDPLSPSVVSWLGVSYYLTRDAIESTLATVARWAAGTSILLDYFVPVDELDPTMRQRFLAQADLMEDLGEPWLTFFSSAEIEHVLRASGFQRVVHHDERATRRFFDGRGDGLRHHPLYGIVAAWNG